MKTTEENNRMIAEFMGYEMNTVEVTMPEKFRVITLFKHSEGAFTTTIFKFGDLRFHVDWNWLMPVVEKIDKLMLDQPIISPFEVNAEYVFSSLREVNIKLTFKRVVQFIEWYNEQK